LAPTVYMCIQLIILFYIGLQVNPIKLASIAEEGSVSMA